MPVTAPLSRADILTCVRHYGPATLETFAHLLGYAPAPPVPTPLPPEEAAPLPEDSTVPAPPPAPPPAPAQATFYRVVAQRLLPAAEMQRDEPEWYQKAVPLALDDAVLRADPQAPPPPPAPPLMPWSRLWPCLKAALGALADSASLDVPRLVELLARGQVFQHVPRLPQRGWALRAQVLLDYAEPLLPFWDDMHTLHTRLRRLRGVEGLTLLAFPDGHPAGRCQQWTPQGWQECDGYRLPAAGTPVLVVSDVGCLDASTARRTPWQRLGQRLRQAGCQPVALMPCPVRLWQAEVTSLFAPVCWDRAVRPPRHLAPRRQAPPALSTDEGTPRLLQALGAAIRVEPALLRAVRYLLPACKVDVGNEAAAWNHAHVHATALGFYYDPERIADYRKAFQTFAEANPPLAQQIAARLLAAHAPLSPVIGLEERWLLAESGCLPHQTTDDEDFLACLVRTVVAGSSAASPTRAWGLRLEQRQEGQSWQHDKLQALWGAVHRQDLRAGVPLTLPAGIDLARLSWLLAAGDTSRDYTLRQRAKQWVLEADPPAPSDLSRHGTPLGRLRATAPHVTVQGQAQPITTPIPLSGATRLRLRTDQQELTLEWLPGLAWVDSMGCDAHGLCITWADGQRRAYWVSPGPYPVHTRTGARLDDLVLQHGFWADAAEALALLHDGFQQPSWAETYGQDAYGLYAEVRVAGVTQRLRWIAPGEFLMGSPLDEPERRENETQHPVLLTRSYWLADTTCTQALWQAVMGQNLSHFQGAELPVEQVSWEEAQAFLQRLNGLVADEGFRLPTEAEWEYACRAGTTTPFWFGNQITPEQGNYDGNYPYADGPAGVYREKTVPVQELPCNSWGLYQMHGNVWEWCQDWYEPYPASPAVTAAVSAGMPAVDPMGPVSGDGRVLRGGSWISLAGSARSAQRFALQPARRDHYIGFRCARGQELSKAGPEALPEASPGRAGQATRSGDGQARPRRPRRSRRA